MASLPPFARARQELSRLVPSLRAAAAVTACLVGSQFAGRTGLGLILAVGARRVITADPGGEPVARAAIFCLAAVAASLGAFGGTLAGDLLAASSLGMFALGWVVGAARSHSEAAGRVALAPAITFALAQIL